MSRHEHFEELGAFAAIGEISGEELAQLDAHISECDSCRAARDEYSQILHKGLPLADPNAMGARTASGLVPRDANYRERFLARARAQGIQFSDEAEQRESSLGRFYVSFLRPNLAAGLAIFVLTTAGVTAYTWWQGRMERQRASTIELRREVLELSNVRDRLQAQLAREAQSQASLEGQLSESQEAAEAALARANALEKQLQSTMTDVVSLRTDLEKSGAKTGDLQNRLQAEERQLAELNTEIQKLRAARADDAATIAEQENRVSDLSSQVQAQTEMIDREGQLMAAGRDIRDLMGARNLHVVDVYDVDGKGKDRRAFGRVFYTEGKSLIFYAFDLSSSQQVMNVKHSFQAWGELEGTPGSAKSLGIFYVDNQAQKRWVLKVEDPELLQQIDAVFVTVEPFGGANKPTGQRLLYAYLNAQANHP